MPTDSSAATQHNYGPLIWCSIHQLYRVRCRLWDAVRSASHSFFIELLV